MFLIEYSHFFISHRMNIGIPAWYGLEKVRMYLANVRGHFYAFGIEGKI
jgi:hypothetical protein